MRSSSSEYISIIFSFVSIVHCGGLPAVFAHSRIYVTQHDDAYEVEEATLLLGVGHLHGRGLATALQQTQPEFERLGMEGEDVRQRQHQRRGTRLRALAGFHVDLKGTRREWNYFAEQVVEVGGHLVHVGGVAEEHGGFRLGVVGTTVTYTQLLEKLLHAGRGIPVG